MVYLVCFISYAQFGVCKPQRTNYYVLRAQEHLLRKREKKNHQTFVRCDLRASRFLVKILVKRCGASRLISYRNLSLYCLITSVDRVPFQLTKTKPR